MKKKEDVKKDFSELRDSLRHGFSRSKIKEFIRSLPSIKIEKNLLVPKIKETKNLSVNEDYYKPIKTKSAFSGNYIDYESKGVKDKNLSPGQYLDIIRPYLSNMINDHKTIREWKIQLTMQINFISHKDSKETRTMYTKSRNIEIMEGNETDEIIEELSESPLKNLFLKVLIYCITTFKSRFEKERIIYRFS